MPRYTYRCSKCQIVFSGFSSIDERNTPQECECGGSAPRDVASELQDFGDVNATMKSNERWSFSMGIHVDKIPEMEKKHPDRKYHPKTGQLLVRNRVHKKKLMKEHGMTEY